MKNGEQPQGGWGAPGWGGAAGFARLLTHPTALLPTSPKQRWCCPPRGKEAHPCSLLFPSARCKVLPPELVGAACRFNAEMVLREGDPCRRNSKCRGADVLATPSVFSPPTPLLSCRVYRGPEPGPQQAPQPSLLQIQPSEAETVLCPGGSKPGGQAHRTGTPP